MMNFRFSIPLLIIINLSAIPVKSRELCDIKIINRNNRVIKLSVEIADTDRKRMLGLMNRRILKQNSGMLFQFPYKKKMNFWMKNTYIPLSIAYINQNGIINEIYNMKPLDVSVTYPSGKPAKYALEVNHGWFKKNNISLGNRIIFNGCIGK